ncbi:bifunctional DNA-formamidopyrimidine glycosylase/DNA-(apurinic or apyrimidinic site) lyase [soil metagenome]
MPELPEVETIRREIDKDVVGRKVKDVEVHGMNAVRRHPNKKHFASKLDGVKIKAVERRAAALVLRLDSEDRWVIRLGDRGHLRRVPAKDPLEAGTHVVVSFTQGGQLRFIDASGDGEMGVTSADALLEDWPELDLTGLDPVDEPMSWTVFGQRLLTSRGKLKAVLMDPSVVAGVGPVYSDEILFAAGLRHDRLMSSLSTQEIRRLYRAVVETMHEAVKHHGSTLRDGSFTNLRGDPGGYQEQHQVYERDGEACRRCRATLVKNKFAGKPAYSCTECQV